MSSNIYINLVRVRELADNKLLFSWYVTDQLYNMFPWFKWIPGRKNLMKSVAAMRKHVTDRIGGLQETLNPPVAVRTAETRSIFRRRLKTHLFKLFLV